MSTIEFPQATRAPLLLNIWEGEGLSSKKSCYAFLSTAARVAALGMALAARIPSIAVARAASPNNQAYGWFLAMSNLISYGSLIGWSFLEIVNNEIEPRSESEKILIKNGKISLGTATKITLLIIGLLSQVPFNYMAYKFNNGNLVMTILITTDATLPVHSLYLSVRALKAAYRKHFASKSEKNLLSRKEECIQLISECQSKLIAFSSRTQQESQSLLDTGHSMQDRNSSLSVEVSNRNLSSRATISKCDTFAVTLLGYTVTIGRLILFTVLGYHASDLLFHGATKISGWKLSALNYTTASLVCLSNAYLLKDLIAKRLVLIYSEIKNRVSCKHKNTLMEELRPKISLLTKVIVLSLAGFGYSTPYSLSSNTFQKEKGTGFQETMIATSIVAVFVLSFHALTHLSNDLLEASVLKWGTSSEIGIVNEHRRLKKFIEVLKISEPEEVEAFIGSVCDSSSSAEELGNNLYFHEQVNQRIRRKFKNPI